MMEFAMDVRGKVFSVGQRAVRGVSLNKAGSVGLEVVEVTHVKDGKVYLNHSNVPIKYPDRLAILS
jgi:hypothetical protein